MAIHLTYIIIRRLSESAGMREQCSKAEQIFEANKVNFSAVLLQNQNCRKLRKIDA